MPVYQNSRNESCHYHLLATEKYLPTSLRLRTDNIIFETVSNIKVQEQAYAYSEDSNQSANTHSLICLSYPPEETDPYIHVAPIEGFDKTAWLRRGWSRSSMDVHAILYLVLGTD